MTEPDNTSPIEYTKQVKRKINVPSKDKIFKCTGYDHCHMTFNRAEHLARHIRKHTGEKPFQCYICLKYFSRIDNLKQHRETVHSKLKNLPNFFNSHTKMVNDQLNSIKNTASPNNSNNNNNNTNHTNFLVQPQNGNIYSYMPLENHTIIQNGMVSNQFNNPYPALVLNEYPFATHIHPYIPDNQNTNGFPDRIPNNNNVDMQMNNSPSIISNSDNNVPEMKYNQPIATVARHFTNTNSANTETRPMSSRSSISNIKNKHFEQYYGQTYGPYVSLHNNQSSANHTNVLPSMNYTLSAPTTFIPLHNNNNNTTTATNNDASYFMKPSYEANIPQQQQQPASISALPLQFDQDKTMPLPKNYQQVNSKIRLQEPPPPPQDQTTTSGPQNLSSFSQYGPNPLRQPQYQFQPPQGQFDRSTFFPDSSSMSKSTSGSNSVFSNSINFNTGNNSVNGEYNYGNGSTRRPHKLSNRSERSSTPSLYSGITAASTTGFSSSTSSSSTPSTVGKDFNNFNKSHKRKIPYSSSSSSSGGSSSSSGNDSAISNSGSSSSSSSSSSGSSSNSEDSSSDTGESTTSIDASLQRSKDKSSGKPNKIRNNKSKNKKQSKKGKKKSKKKRSKNNGNSNNSDDSTTIAKDSNGVSTGQNQNDNGTSDRLRLGYIIS